MRRDTGREMGYVGGYGRRGGNRGKIDILRVRDNNCMYGASTLFNLGDDFREAGGFLPRKLGYTNPLLPSECRRLTCPMM